MVEIEDNEKIAFDANQAPFVSRILPPTVTVGVGLLFIISLLLLLVILVLGMSLASRSASHQRWGAAQSTKAD